MRRLNFTPIDGRFVPAIFILILFFSSVSFNIKSQDLDSLLDLNLETVLDIQTKGRGDVGSFGYRLSGEEATTTIHGYVTNEFHEQQEVNSTFDNHYFNIFVGTKVGDKIFAELQMEYEHGGEEIQARYAQLDYKVSDAFIIRTGKFLLPINTFNEYIYPEYINKTISRPFINRNITPTAWGEVGLQVRGVAGSDDFKFNYAAFVVNGLQGDEGGDIRGMRNNHRDKKHSNKAIGGKVGFMTKGIEFGAGVYSGKYTEDGEHNLTIAAFDAGYNNNNLTVRAEYDLATLGTSADDINRNGASLMVAYAINRIEPVFRYDFMDWDDPDDETKNKNRIYLGVNYLIANTMNFKVGYEIINNDGEDIDDNIISLQLALGF